MPRAALPLILHTKLTCSSYNDFNATRKWNESSYDKKKIEIYANPVKILTIITVVSSSIYNILGYNSIIIIQITVIH